MSTATAPVLNLGSRAGGQVRLAELLWAGISGRPEGLRETALVLVASTRIGLGVGEHQAWTAQEVSKALARIERAGGAVPVEDDGDTRWVPVEGAPTATGAPIGPSVRTCRAILAAIDAAESTPTAEVLADVLGLDGDTVGVALAELVARGEVERARSGGRWTYGRAPDA